MSFNIACNPLTKNEPPSQSRNHALKSTTGLNNEETKFTEVRVTNLTYQNMFTNDNKRNGQNRYDNGDGFKNAVNNLPVMKRNSTLNRSVKYKMGLKNCF